MKCKVLAILVSKKCLGPALTLRWETLAGEVIGTLAAQSRAPETDHHFEHVWHVQLGFPAPKTADRLRKLR